MRPFTGPFTGATTAWAFALKNTQKCHELLDENSRILQDHISKNQGSAKLVKKLAKKYTGKPYI